MLEGGASEAAISVSSSRGYVGETREYLNRMTVGSRAKHVTGGRAAPSPFLRLYGRHETGNDVNGLTINGGSLKRLIGIRFQPFQNGRQPVYNGDASLPPLTLPTR
jgi:hypothetical protein